MDNIGEALFERKENTKGLFNQLLFPYCTIKEILPFLVKGVDIKQKSDDDKTLLTLACQKGADKEVVDWLIKMGADVNEIDGFAEPALGLACLFGYHELAELLIVHGADIEKTNSKGETALFTTSSAVIKLLISKGANVNHVNHKGDTTLNQAILFNKSSDSIQTLIDGGSDVRKANYTGETPLSRMLIRKSDDLDSEMNYFISKGYGPELIQQFFKGGGADANVVALIKGMTSKYTMDQIMVDLLPHLRFGSAQHLIGLAARDETAHQFLDGFTVALIKAGRSGGLPLLIQRNDLEHLRNFFIEGCKNCSPKLQQKIRDEGNLFLVGVEEAIEKQNINTSELWRELSKPNPNNMAIQDLIEKGVNTSDIQNGTTLLIKAYDKDLYDIMEMLLLHGADVNQPILGLTALAWASQWGDRSAIDILITNGAHVNHADEDGRTPLHRATAAQKNSLECVLALVEKGAGMELQSKKGLTPLHEASRNGSVAVINVLIDRGVDVNQNDNEWRTPLHHAAEKGKLDAMLALISRGASLYKRDSKDLTPLNELLRKKSQNHMETIKYFVEKGYGNDLLNAMLQHGGEEENLNTLLREVFRKDPTFDLSQLHLQVSSFVFHKLVEHAQNSEWIDQFLDRLMQAELSSQWVSNSSERQIQLVQQSFIFYQSEDPTKYTVEVQGRTPLNISKNRFYEICYQEGGNPEDIVQAIFAGPRPFPGAYSLEIERSLIEKISLQVLEIVSEKFREALHDQFSIIFTGEVGQDAGGLGRQFVNQLFASAASHLKFNRRENGLYRPKLVENSEGDFPPLNDDERKAYRSLGEVMMFCLNADPDRPYPIGMLFDQGVFDAIARMDPGDLQKEFGEIAFDDPTVFQRMFGIYKNMNRFVEGDVKMIQLLERSLAPKNDAELKEAYQVVMHDPAIQALKINGNAAKMKEHQAAIEAAVKRYAIEMKLKPALAPLFEMSKGMQGSPFGYRIDFAKVQTLSPIELSQRLQGIVSKEDILKKLKFDGIPDNIQSWFINWVQQADDKRIEDFIFALSGSGALGKDADIKIVEQGQFMFHTCFNTFDLKCEVIHTEADLVRDLTWAIDHAKAQGGFDTA